MELVDIFLSNLNWIMDPSLLRQSNKKLETVKKLEIASILSKYFYMIQFKFT